MLIHWKKDSTTWSMTGHIIDVGWAGTGGRGGGLSGEIGGLHWMGLLVLVLAVTAVSFCYTTSSLLLCVEP